MQKELNIKTKDKKIIYGTVNTPKGESNGLIIFVHGLTDNFDSHMLPNSAKYFTDKGYITYRFNLYGEKKQERKLKEVNLKNHVNDLNIVIKHFEKMKQKIFIVGHSFGGLTILYSNIKRITGIILRDASIGGKELLDDVHYNSKTHMYNIDRGDGIIHIIGSTMYKDFMINPQKHLERISKIHVPIKIICAGNGLQVGKKYNKVAYYKAANKPKELSIIVGAGHCFDVKGTEEKLFEETYKRIKRFSK
ncbi:MAG: alpha/beta fold hydrolase [Candidatus Absconditabacterales bacterium]